MKYIIPTKNFLLIDKKGYSFKDSYKYYLLMFINPFREIYYNIKYFLFGPKSRNNDAKYNVSLCAIFKDEGPYLKEWIEFHKIVGVEHFYLYNNKSNDNYLEVLTPYIKEGLVTLKDWPKPQSQMEAYDDFSKTDMKESKWVGFIDIDEFVVPKKDKNIYSFLKNFENRSAVIIYWKYFGTSGLYKRDINGLVTNDFYLSWAKNADIGKFFFNTKFDYEIDFKKNGRMHYAWGLYKGNCFPPVNLFNKICSIYECNVANSSNFPIQINHYALKSYEEYYSSKVNRGGGVSKNGCHDDKWFIDREMLSTTPDYSAYKYLILLKKAMGVKDDK